MEGVQRKKKISGHPDISRSSRHCVVAVDTIHFICIETERIERQNERKNPGERGGERAGGRGRSEGAERGGRHAGQAERLSCGVLTGTETKERKVGCIRKSAMATY